MSSTVIMRKGCRKGGGVSGKVPKTRGHDHATAFEVTIVGRGRGGKKKGQPRSTFWRGWGGYDGGHKKRKTARDEEGKHTRWEV